MARSLIGGLVANGSDPSAITACDIDRDILQNLASDFGINISSDNQESAKRAEMVVLAVKPQAMQAVCEPLSGLAHREDQLFISVAAGVRLTDIDRWLGGSRALVRCMPNTPALIQLGATGLYANPRVSGGQKVTTEQILGAVGICLWVDEETQLDAVTAISGSGPAYFFYFIELLQQAGVELGLDKATATVLARQTALGAATMAQTDDVAELRTRVTSRKGTTEQAIRSFQQNGLDRLVRQATRAAYERSLELAGEFSNQS